VTLESAKKKNATDGAIRRASRGAFFFVWTLIALGVTGLFSVILAAYGLRSLQRDVRH
jgi:hypothetical protein